MLAHEALRLRLALWLAAHCAAIAIAVSPSPLGAEEAVAPDSAMSAATCAGTAAIVAGAGRCLAPGESFKDCDSCPEMVVVPPGGFVMGSPESEEGRDASEGPQQTVTISKAFAAGKFEVTFAEWDGCVADGGCQHKPRDPGWGRGRRPVVNVSWNDVTAQFLPWLSKKTGQVYRLLSEAEWEYAARAGTSAPFFTGATLTTDQANFDGTASYAGSPKGVYLQHTLEVGAFAANAFGLHDMHGNVWEFVQDCFSSDYANRAASSPNAAPPDACTRVVRGGSWIDSPRVLRSAYRGRIAQDARFIYRGFRIARGF